MRYFIFSSIFLNLNSRPQFTSVIFMFLIFRVSDNKVISTNTFVLLAMHFTCYTARTIKPLHVKKIFLQEYFLQISLKLT